jgi:hypothetical protein
MIGRKIQYVFLIASYQVVQMSHDAISDVVNFPHSIKVLSFGLLHCNITLFPCEIDMHFLGGYFDIM